MTVSGFVLNLTKDLLNHPSSEGKEGNEMNKWSTIADVIMAS